MLGGSCRFVIENVNKSKALNLTVQPSQISINYRVYKTNSNIWEDISNITKKYDKDAIG